MRLKQWLDRTTGRFTMYQTVFVLLVAISVLALLLSLLGLIGPTPLQLLASYIVAVPVTVASSLGFARLFRVKPHLMSAAITGILVFIVLAPTDQPLGLLGIAVAAIIASASKYLLAIRGRHVFNPAAIGGLIVTTAGLGFSGWWVATIWMLPLVALGALLVLYRTRRLTMGLVFVATVLIVDVARTGSLANGASLALLATATVFLAGFMLSEPLTMPPKRWQQLGLAVLVGLLFAIPFNLFGLLYSSPQLALVIGNLVAFFFGQRRGIALTLVSKEQLTPTTWEFTFRPARPVSFTPGQYMELTVPHAKADRKGTRRMFSISSAPGDTVTFALKITAEVSSFKAALLALTPGSVVRGSLVAGDFALPRSLDVPVLLVAGGIGITPFASQLAHHVGSSQQRDLVVVYAVSDPSELAYSALLEQSGARVVVTAPTAPERLPAGWTYGGTRVTREVILAEVPDAASRRAYVSGPPSLVNSMRAVLRSLGVRRVTSDYFLGY